jgi:hypothetical protein
MKFTFARKGDFGKYFYQQKKRKKKELGKIVMNITDNY